MAMAQDSRTSTFGNMIVITGTYDTGGGTLDMTGTMSSVISMVALADGAVPSAANLPRVSDNSLTLGITSADAAQAGSWMAIGLRG